MTLPPLVEKLASHGVLEVGVVALVLGSFAAAAVGDATGAAQCQQHAQGTELEAAAVGAAVQAWAEAHGRYPTAAEGLAVVADRFDAGAPPDDYFGRPFQYRVPSPTGAAPFALVSYGRDGTPGGIGEDEDLVWTP